HRAEIDVLVELAAELDQGAPERDVIGHLRRPAGGPVEDRVVPADLLLPVVGEHRAVLEVIVATGEREVIERERQVEPAGGLLQDAQAFGDDFLADAVAGDDRDPERFHRDSSRNGWAFASSASGASSGM